MYKSRILRSSSLIPLCLALLVGAGAKSASAQVLAQNTATGVEDIVVTAQKRSESIQDVPATITAFSQEALETRQIKDIGDLTTRVPSLQVGSTFGSNLITLRGISTNITSGFEDPSVAVHVNGVYQARARSLNLALMDLERVEVLSGPQGTLYGRNATGGVVNYILRGPTAETEAEITGRVGNYESYGLRGYIAGPINEKVGFRIAGLWDNRDKGFIKNLLAGAPKSSFGDNKVAAIRGVLEFNPTETLSIDVEGSFSHTRATQQTTVLSPSISPVRFAQLGTQSFRPREVYSELDGKFDTKDYSASTTVTWDVSDNVQLKSISAFQKYKNFMLIDYDASAAIIETIPSSNHSRTYTQEFNLNTSSFDGRLQSIFGVYYFNDRITQWTEILSSAFGGNNARIFRADFIQKAESVAFFTDHTFSVTDKLRLIAGIRHNIDKKKTDMTILGSCFHQQNSRKFTAWTPRAGLQYDVTDNLMAYATYQKGFKAGGFASGTCDNPYEPESIEGGEAGIKTQLADNRIRLNVAGYWYDYTNLQVQRTLGSVGGYAVNNAGESRIKGIEGNLEAAITDQLRFDVAAMVQSAKYTNYSNCDQTTFFGACSAADPRPVNDPTRLQQLRGNRLNRAAPWSISVGLQYTFDLAGGELMLRGESFWSGRLHFVEFNTRELSQAPYDLQNAYVTFTPENDRYTLRAFAKNIGNVSYKSGAFYNGFTAQNTANWNIGRTYGAEVSVRF